MLAVGPGGLDKNGTRIPMSVAPGDRVLLPQVRFVGFPVDPTGGLTRGLAVWWKLSKGGRGGVYPFPGL